MSLGIVVKDVTVRLGGRSVLDHLDVTVEPGDWLTIVGPNGSGKTTLLKVLATLARPTRGTVIVAGHDCAKDPELVRREIGLVAHSSYVYEDLTAAENLAFWTTLAGLTSSAAERASALATVELERAAGERVRTFSAGMKRRLSLARFVLARPRVLLLDEPFPGLDQRAKKWLEEHLASFKAGGAAIVMTTHSFGRELAVADRIAVLAGGAIALDTPRGSLSTDDVHRLYALHAEDAS